jgi:hypothetical protein
MVLPSRRELHNLDVRAHSRECIDVDLDDVLKWNLAARDVGDVERTLGGVSGAVLILKRLQADGEVDNGELAGGVGGGRVVCDLVSDAGRRTGEAVGYVTLRQMVLEQLDEA